MLALVSAIVLLFAIIALVAYPRFKHDTGAVEITTEPPGATIEIDGQDRGTTAGGSLVVRDLQADAAHRVIARAPGRVDAESVLRVVGEGTSAIRLVLPSRTASVKVESEPPGATILAGGRELGTTPATLEDLPPGQDVELVLRLAGYRETPKKLRVPQAGGEVIVLVSLPIAAELASVRITSDPPGAAVLQNGERLAGLVTPVASHLVEAGKSYTFTLELAGYMPAKVDVQVGAGERDVPVHAAMAPGGELVIGANVPARASVPDSRACRNRPLPLDCPIENGRHKVELRNADPYLNATLDVTIAGDKVTRTLEYGIVRARDGFAIAAGGTQVHAVALEPGPHGIVVVPADGSARRTEPVVVRAGATHEIP
jgi:hypothetical protein